MGLVRGTFVLFSRWQGWFPVLIGTCCSPLRDEHCFKGDMGLLFTEPWQFFICYLNLEKLSLVSQTNLSVMEIVSVW